MKINSNPQQHNPKRSYSDGKSAQPKQRYTKKQPAPKQNQPVQRQEPITEDSLIQMIVALNLYRASQK